MSSKNKATNPGDTAVKVLECLEQIALEKGLDALSMRDVAKRVGISLASLQYHFPTKAVLLEAFVKRTVDEFREETREILAAGGDGEPVMPVVIQHALEEAAQSKQGNLLLMIWARSLHDETAQTNFDELMRIYLEAVAEAIGFDFPDLSPYQRMLAATLTVSMLEGFTATYDVAKTLGVDANLLPELTNSVVVAISELFGSKGGNSI